MYGKAMALVWPDTGSTDPSVTFNPLSSPTLSPGMERTRDVEPKLILSIDAVTLARVGRKASGTKVTLGEDVFATRVMILSASEAEK